VQAHAATSGIPATAVQAYGNATLREAAADPGCHLGWTTLAGIGTVESVNGTIGGRTLLTSGYSSTPITGPALDGRHGYADVGDGAGGYARALGPMQFISSSWQRWAADGDGDGVGNVYDIFDAALGTAAYLCADGGDLATASGWSAAIYSYNHSEAYVREVYAAANAAAGS
jgi:membrane-bound lytic murein transglycosylase B